MGQSWNGFGACRVFRDRFVVFWGISVWGRQELKLVLNPDRHRTTSALRNVGCLMPNLVAILIPRREGNDRVEEGRLILFHSFAKKNYK